MGVLISILLSAAYFFTIPWHPFPGSWVIKAASVAILSVTAFRRGATMLAIGLALSALGDALLEYAPNLFVGGLVAFLAAHIVYTVTFVRVWRERSIRPAAIAVIVYSAILGAWIVPAVGSLAVPVTIYVAAITAMVVSAITARLARWLELGVLLFLISDSVLAINRFRTPVPLGGWIVWATYYVGQLLIATNFVSARESHTRRRSAAAGQG